MFWNISIVIWQGPKYASIEYPYFSNLHSYLLLFSIIFFQNLHQDGYVVCFFPFTIWKLSNISKVTFCLNFRILFKSTHQKLISACRLKFFIAFNAKGFEITFLVFLSFLFQKLFKTVMASKENDLYSRKIFRVD